MTGMTDTNLWICQPVNRAARRAKLRLFCFPAAGMGAWVFHKWEARLPDFVEIMPVEFPGRNSRIGESCMDEMGTLVAKLVSDLLPVFEEMPFAMFGHSMGAFVAFEVCAMLARLGGVKPVKLFVSGCRAPHLEDCDLEKLGDLDYDRFWAGFTRR